MKILLVEPDEYYHHQFAKQLGGSAELISVKDPVAALRTIEKTPPDVVISEMLVPEISIYDFLEQMREMEHAWRIPLIIYTRVSEIRDIEQVLQRGVMAYFVKGLDSVRDINQLLLTLAAP